MRKGESKVRNVALQPERLEALLETIGRVRAVAIGDVCLDVYWIADMRRATLSRETPHFNLPVTEERYSLGAAGNAMSNMRALGATVLPLTLLGEDWRGGIVRRLMAEMSLPSDGLIAAPGRITPAYVKPYRCGHGDVRYEDPRIDFENAQPPCEAAERMLVEALERAADGADVIVVSDQLGTGVVTPRVRETLCALAAAGRKVIVDSRDNIAAYKGCILKPNELEAARAASLAPAAVTPEEYLPVARKLRETSGGDVIITLGAAGAMCLGSDGEPCFAPAMRVPPPIDIVGAGDSFLSACALALGAGAALEEAIALGNLASSVTIQKIGQTGTASAAEIRAAYAKRG